MYSQGKNRFLLFTPIPRGFKEAKKGSRRVYKISKKKQNSQTSTAKSRITDPNLLAIGSSIWTDIINTSNQFRELLNKFRYFCLELHRTSEPCLK